MSDIKVRRNHSLPLEEARKAAEKIAERLKKDFDLWDKLIRQLGIKLD